MNCLRCDAEVELAGKINKCKKCEFTWLVYEDSWWSSPALNVTWYWTDNKQRQRKRMPDGCLLVARDIEL